MNLEKIENMSENVKDKSIKAVDSLKENIGKFDEMSNAEKIDKAMSWVKDNPGKSTAIGLVALISMRSRTMRNLAAWAGVTVGTYLLKDTLKDIFSDKEKSIFSNKDSMH